MYICYDVGGTSIKAGIIDNRGNIVKKISEPTIIGKGIKGTIKQFNNIKDLLLRETGMSPGSIKGIGVGIPGFVEEGTVIEAVNLGWQNIPIKREMEEYMDYPVFIINDANAAALGELWRGAGVGCEDLVCITIGTGIGAGVIIGGSLYSGNKGLAGEVGHIKVRREGGRRCNCGKRGCLETESSGTAIAYYGEKAAKEKEGTVLGNILREKGRLNSKDIADAAYSGDACALEVINRAAYFLGLALANIYAVLAPQRIIIGGGVAQAGDILTVPTVKWFNSFALNNTRGEELIFRAKLANDAGIIGLAKLVKTRLKSNYGE